MATDHEELMALEFRIIIFDTLEMLSSNLFGKIDPFSKIVYDQNIHFKHSISIFRYRWKQKLIIMQHLELKYGLLIIWTIKLW